jgi:hypothetical protein
MRVVSHSAENNLFIQYLALGIGSFRYSIRDSDENIARFQGHASLTEDSLRK